MKLHRLQAVLRLLSLSVLLAACGGGVETGGTGATGTYVEGPISGFGSVIVDGVRFDEAGAAIEDVDGAPRRREELRLGMRLEVFAGAIADDSDGGRSATATRVRIGTDLLGPVTFADAGANAISVLGQVVRATPATVLDGLPGGLASVSVGDLVEVHGFLDPGIVLDRFIATRIERRTAMPAQFLVRGPARDVDQAARTLRVGGQTFDLSSTGVPAGLIAGQVVRMRLQTAQVAGRWPVSSIEVESRRLDDRDEAGIEGVITTLTSATRFELNGIAVDATQANFVDGTAGVVQGARVKVRGRAVGGLLLATVVDIRSDDEAFNDGVDLRDRIASLDTAARTFVVRGVTVFYGTSPGPRYDNGTEGDLANDRLVRVRAVLSTDRTRVEASRVEFLAN